MDLHAIAYSNFDMVVVLSPTPTVTPGFWRSCIRKIRSSPAINATGEKMSPWSTPLAMSNGSESVIVPSGCLSHYDLLNDTQLGFMRGRSCLTNLLTYMEGVTRMLDAGKNMDIIYLDFAKAFDKVPHHRLIGKVASMGVEGRVKGWIQQWLEGRMQRVVINGIFRLDRRYKWCTAGIGPRCNSLPYVHK